MASLQAESILSKLGVGRMSSEKQETLLKLLILATAAILCEHVGPSLAALGSSHTALRVQTHVSLLEEGR